MHMTAAMQAYQSPEPPAVQATPENPSTTKMADESDRKEIEKEVDEVTEAMFSPKWTEQLGLNYSAQPSQAGQGQIQEELNFTGTYHITESGHFFRQAPLPGGKRWKGSVPIMGN